jgi:chromosome segregation ATPase
MGTSVDNKPSPAKPPVTPSSASSASSAASDSADKAAISAMTSGTGASEAQMVSDQLKGAGQELRAMGDALKKLTAARDQAKALFDAANSRLAGLSAVPVDPKASKSTQDAHAAQLSSAQQQVAATNKVLSDIEQQVTDMTGKMSKQSEAIASLTAKLPGARARDTAKADAAQSRERSSHEARSHHASGADPAQSQARATQHAQWKHKFTPSVDPAPDTAISGQQEPERGTRKI